MSTIRVHSNGKTFDFEDAFFSTGFSTPNSFHDTGELWIYKVKNESDKPPSRQNIVVYPRGCWGPVEVITPAEKKKSKR